MLFSELHKKCHVYAVTKPTAVAVFPLLLLLLSPGTLLMQTPTSCGLLA
jgi:hypothetical protein